MLALVLALVATLQAQGPEVDDAGCGELETACEVTTGLDGITTATCGGRVMYRTDGKGNGWERLSDGTIHVRQDDGKDLVL